jgi:hypothetical protein
MQAVTETVIPSATYEATTFLVVMLIDSL